MDRFSWAIAAVALVLFAALVVVASVMTSDPTPPRVSCTGQVGCTSGPHPDYGDRRDPLAPTAPPDRR